MKIACIAGHKYHLPKQTDDNNQPMVEYHFDACAEFQETTLMKFGGNLSVQKPAGDMPLVTF